MGLGKRKKNRKRKFKERNIFPIEILWVGEYVRLCARAPLFYPCDYCIIIYDDTRTGNRNFILIVISTRCMYFYFTFSWSRYVLVFVSLFGVVSASSTLLHFISLPHLLFEKKKSKKKNRESPKNLNYLFKT